MEEGDSSEVNMESIAGSLDSLYEEDFDTSGEEYDDSHYIMTYCMFLYRH